MERDCPAAEKIVQMIHKNGGLAVLAHPGVNMKGKESCFRSFSELAWMVWKPSAAIIQRSKRCFMPNLLRGMIYLQRAEVIFTAK